MRYRTTAILLFLFALCSSAQIRLIDVADGSPVQAASVFVDGGRCVGVSGNDGLLPLPKGYNGMVTVQQGVPHRYGTRRHGEADSLRICNTRGDGQIRAA